MSDYCPYKYNQPAAAAYHRPARRHAALAVYFTPAPLCQARLPQRLRRLASVGPLR